MIRALVAALLSFAAATGAAGAAAPSRAEAEAAFLKTVDAKANVYRLTADLREAAGTHVAYICDVDRIVQPTVILAQCGAEAEPTDFFVFVPQPVRVGARIRILGVMDTPASWTDAAGHTVFYAFVRAMYVDPAARSAVTGAIRRP